MMRRAMVNLNSVFFVALFFVAPLLLGAVAGERNGSSSTSMEMEEGPGMITLNQSSSSSRPGERRLATTMVWCISIPNVSDATLQSSLDWVCGPEANQGQVNCGPINAGGACYDPNTVAHHCDWAFNSYFLRMNGTAESCSFGGTAQEVTTDPSSGNCTFTATSVTVNGSTGTPGAGPSNSPLSPPGSPIYSPSAATPALQPHYLFRLSTVVVLMTSLFT